MTSLGALRQRRYERRQKGGRIVLMIEVDVVDVEVMLEASKLLPDGCEHSRQELTAALERWIRLLAALPPD